MYAIANKKRGGIVKRPVCIVYGPLIKITSLFSKCTLRTMSYYFGCIKVKCSLSKQNHFFPRSKSGLNRQRLYLTVLDRRYLLRNKLEVDSRMPRKLLVWWCSNRSKSVVDFCLSSVSVELEQQWPPHIGPEKQKNINFSLVI